MTCMIDGSHMRVTDFDLTIVEFGVTFHRITLDPEDQALVERARLDSRELVSDLSPADAEALSYLAESVVDQMADQSGGVAAWWVEESCLWYELDPEYASEQQAAYDDQWS